MKIGKIEFGKPYIHSKKSVSIAVPILRKDSPDRNYVTVEEIKDKVKLIDTGKIDEIRIEGDFDQAVFIRSGTMFEGVGTQTRASEKSIVIMPERKSVPVEVKCIHASHPISTGASFRIGGSTHPRVQYALMSGRGQGEVWASVGKASKSMSSGMRLDSGIGAMTDNLAENMKKVSEFKKEINEIIKKIPTDEFQIGVVILDLSGVVGFEMFDSPESWKAVSKDIIKKYSDKLLEEAEEPIFKLDEEIMKIKILSFLKSMEEGDEAIIFEDGPAKTISVSGVKIIGEYTKIGEKTIHIIGIRKEKDEEERPRYSPLRETRRNYWDEIPRRGHYGDFGERERPSHPVLMWRI